MSSRETPKPTTGTSHRYTPVQILNRAAQTRQRAEALFQQAERLRKMPAQTFPKHASRGAELIGKE